MAPNWPQLQHLEIALGVTLAVSTFLYKVYRHVVKPLYRKIVALIDAELSRRQRMDEMYEWYLGVSTYTSATAKFTAKKASASGTNGGVV